MTHELTDLYLLVTFVLKLKVNFFSYLNLEAQSVIMDVAYWFSGQVSEPEY